MNITSGRSWSEAYVEMIINWNRKTNSKKIWHIHGSNDHTLPLKHLTVDYIIKKGSHMMTLTDHKKVKKCIDLILVKE